MHGVFRGRCFHCCHGCHVVWPARHASLVTRLLPRQVRTPAHTHLTSSLCSLRLRSLRLLTKVSFCLLLACMNTLGMCCSCGCIPCPDKPGHWMFAPGAKLPGESELRREVGTNHPCIHRVLAVRPDLFGQASCLPSPPLCACCIAHSWKSARLSLLWGALLHTHTHSLIILVTPAAGDARSSCAV